MKRRAITLLIMLMLVIGANVLIAKVSTVRPTGPRPTLTMK